ncbi:MAG: DNA translocase FtsK [Candidatus Chisholmbacteria bacterium]|nr:DNA translocase FtsK [Candidatus Chisholmbacteria bacterium]
MSRRRGRRRAPFKVKLKTDTIHSLTAIGLVSLGVFVILSFSRQGVIFARLSDLITFNFGWSAIFIPYLLIVAGLMLTKLKWKITRPNTFLGSLVSFVGLVGLTKAGNLGQKFWLELADLITTPGAAIILAGIFFVGYVIATETTLDEMLLFGASIVASLQRFASSLMRHPKPLTLTQTGSITIKGMTEEVDKRTLENVKARGETPSPQKSPGKTTEPLADQIVSNAPAAPRVWKYPPIAMLQDSVSGKADRGDLKESATIIEGTLDSFGIKAQVVEVNLGPAVTQYALKIALGTKLSKVTALQNDLALALAAPTGQIRIEAPIPGRNLVGIETPNRSAEFVALKKMLESDAMKNNKSKLALSLGLNVSGEPLVVDLARMPHMLIAGATGSGKSVCVNAFIASMLFRASPEEVKFILVDPKRVELTQYNGIPHLLTPVIVEPEKVISALKWALAEMDRRYKLFAEVGVRNIEGYNELSGFQAMPFIVIIIDELADIMFFAPSEVEDAITRLAQMARATGIHLIISTQRPSVDVITGLIKANIPCRIAFNVTSMVDSRVIIDTPGAEKLLGRGDMLYIPPDVAKPSRIQGTFVSEPEIRELINFLRDTGVQPQYTEEVTTQYTAKRQGRGTQGEDGERDEFFEPAVRVVCEYDRASASLLQRRLSIGYARAARVLDQLEAAGVVSPPEGSKPRDVLIRNAEEFLSSYSG